MHIGLAEAEGMMPSPFQVWISTCWDSSVLSEMNYCTRICLKPCQAGLSLFFYYFIYVILQWE